MFSRVNKDTIAITNIGNEDVHVGEVMACQEIGEPVLGIWHVPQLPLMNIYEREGEKGLVELERKSIYVDILENLLAGVVVSVLLVFFFGECFSLSLPDNET